MLKRALLSLLVAAAAASAAPLAELPPAAEGKLIVVRICDDDGDLTAVRIIAPGPGKWDIPADALVCQMGPASAPPPPAKPGLTT